MRNLDVGWAALPEQAADIREADAELRRAIWELQRILDQNDPAEVRLDSEQLYREWLWSLNVIREALCAVDRIAEALSAAAERTPTA